MEWIAKNPRTIVFTGVLVLSLIILYGDLLRLKWDDVYDFDCRPGSGRQRIRDSVTITEQKTGKAKIVALNDRIRTALNLYVHAAKRGDFLILNTRTHKAISRIQAYRIIRTAAEALDMGRVSCHSLRKTFGYHAWKSGVSPAVIIEIYNHSNFAVTRRYLGVIQDDKNEVYRKMASIT